MLDRVRSSASARESISSSSARGMLIPIVVNSVWFGFWAVMKSERIAVADNFQQICFDVRTLSAYKRLMPTERASQEPTADTTPFVTICNFPNKLLRKIAKLASKENRRRSPFLIMLLNEAVEARRARANSNGN